MYPQPRPGAQPVAQLEPWVAVLFWLVAGLFWRCHPKPLVVVPSVICSVQDGPRGRHHLQSGVLCSPYCLQSLFYFHHLTPHVHYCCWWPLSWDQEISLSQTSRPGEMARMIRHPTHLR